MLEIVKSTCHEVVRNNMSLSCKFLMFWMYFLLWSKLPEIYLACFVISPRGPCPSHVNKMICVLNIFLFQQSDLASRADFWVWYWMVLVWRFADWEHFCYESHKEHMNIYSKNQSTFKKFRSNMSKYILNPSTLKLWKLL